MNLFRWGGVFVVRGLPSTTRYLSIRNFSRGYIGPKISKRQIFCRLGVVKRLQMFFFCFCFIRYPFIIKKSKFQAPSYQCSSHDVYYTKYDNGSISVTVFCPCGAHDSSNRHTSTESSDLLHHFQFSETFSANCP